VTSQLPLSFDVPAPRRRTSALEHFHARGETVPEALAGEERAARQEDDVRGLFESLSAGTRLTPWDVAERLGICINSARRACTNLTDAEDLVCHIDDRRQAGPYGQKSRTWSLR